ncbi:palmitoyltransferase ZDHHC1 [Bufo gargarizans]|uniref:palmitoyltransferase ZDHHC1 n=1 Tax=Bufo gargarizans TaxID=30331 RepID=UPI001CF27633|nr:palmitoyltransferase ZDHHC1 [Bufo gargarizans]
MTICKKPSGKTVPVKEGEDAGTEPPQHSRRNGWSWPPHPLQFVAWFTFLLFTIIGFGILVPLLPRHWVAAGYVFMGVLFMLHLIVHFLAVTIDPADEHVRAKGSPGPLPVFDRTKHAHVIENMHCYICEVDVGDKSKHCSLCNKCVSNFDHHCKWLNNCVGGKNYWLFFNCLISAFLGTVVLSTISSYVFVVYFVDPAALRSDQHFEAIQNLSDTWYVFLPAAPVETQASVILGLAALVSVMGLITILLIGQLLCFHIYLLWNKLSTYEYIMHQRQKQEMKSNSREPEAGGTPPTIQEQNENYGGSLVYTNPDVLIEGPSSGSLNTDCSWMLSRVFLSAAADVFPSLPVQLQLDVFPSLPVQLQLDVFPSLPVQLQLDVFPSLPVQLQLDVFPSLPVQLQLDVFPSLPVQLQLDVFPSLPVQLQLDVFPGLPVQLQLCTGRLWDTFSQDLSRRARSHSECCGDSGITDGAEKVVTEESPSLLDSMRAMIEEVNAAVDLRIAPQSPRPSTSQRSHTFDSAFDLDEGELVSDLDSASSDNGSGRPLFLPEETDCLLKTIRATMDIEEVRGGGLFKSCAPALFPVLGAGTPSCECRCGGAGENQLPKKKKKRTKGNRISPEDSNKPSGDIPSLHALPLSNGENEVPVSLAPPGLDIHSPNFPSRSLPVLAPINMCPVQAAGPPAEYHSDSAESMEEIPVAQTHLGSSSMSENLFLTPRNPKVTASEREHGPRPSYFWPGTLQKFELLPKTPSVFVSDSSGKPLPNGLAEEAKAQDSHETRYKKMWVAKGMEGEQVLSISNADVLPSISANK